MLLHAPSHVDLEVSSFLRGVERGRLASRERVTESLGLFLALPLASFAATDVKAAGVKGDD